MINLHEVEQAIAELERSSSTYNNCMKLASLYIIRDEFRNRGQSNYNMYNERTNYTRGRNDYGYYPIYAERGSRGSGRNYHYDPSMEEDLMIRKDNGMMY